MSTVNIKEGKFKVEIDNYNHTLYHYDPGGYEVRVPGKGLVMKKPEWDLIGYYPNMRQCLSKCITIEANEGKDTKTLEEYLDRLKAIINNLEGQVSL